MSRVAAMQRDALHKTVLVDDIDSAAPVEIKGLHFAKEHLNINFCRKKRREIEYCYAQSHLKQ